VRRAVEDAVEYAVEQVGNGLDQLRNNLAAGL
jgi:hypothetical protein